VKARDFFRSITLIEAGLIGALVLIAAVSAWVSA